MFIKLPGDRTINTAQIQYFDFDPSAVVATIFWASMDIQTDLEGDQALAFVTGIEVLKRFPQKAYLDMSMCDPIAQQVLEMP